MVPPTLTCGRSGGDLLLVAQDNGLQPGCRVFQAHHQGQAGSRTTGAWAPRLVGDVFRDCRAVDDLSEQPAVLLDVLTDAYPLPGLERFMGVHTGARQARPRSGKAGYDEPAASLKAAWAAARRATGTRKGEQLT